jgi:hypothetical protein
MLCDGVRDEKGGRKYDLKKLLSGINRLSSFIVFSGTPLEERLSELYA